MQNGPPPCARQAQIDVIENFRRLRAWTPRGRRDGFARYNLRMKLPAAIFVLDDGREVLVDRRGSPLFERAPGQSVGVPSSILKAEMWARMRSAIYLDNPIDQLSPTEDDMLARAEAALRYFGLEPSIKTGRGAP
jgi:hypothetical protein